MCLILFAWKVHRNYPLILIANREEFYERQTAPADFWDDAPGFRPVKKRGELNDGKS